jgi:hypothetical protein
MILSHKTYLKAFGGWSVVARGWQLTIQARDQVSGDEAMQRCSNKQDD